MSGRSSSIRHSLHQLVGVAPDPLHEIFRCSQEFIRNRRFVDDVSNIINRQHDIGESVDEADGGRILEVIV